MKNKLCYSAAKRNVNFLRTMAVIVSIILHPLLMPTYTFFIIAKYAPVFISPFSTALLGFIFITTFLFPFLITATFTGMARKKITFSDLLLEHAEDRVFPLIATSLLYSGITYLLYDTLKEAPFAVWLMGTVTFIVLLVAFITVFWKISAHAAGIFGLLGYILFVDYTVPETNLVVIVCSVILLAGILFSSRLFLRAHTPAQIYAGAFLGFAVSLLSMFMLF